MTEGSIVKIMINFALPVFVGSLLQQLYNMTDALIVGNFAGDEALAAVSSSGSLIYMLTAFILGLFSGAGVVISKYYGSKNMDKLEKAIHTTIALGIIAGIILMVAGILLSEPLLRLMNTPGNVLPKSVTYFQIIFCGSIANVLYNAGSGIFRAVGDSRHPLFYMIISSILNIALDFIFVGLFDWDVAGAAAATIISQLVSCILTCGKLINVRDVYHVCIKKIRVNGELLREILKLGIPSGVQNSVIGFANTVVQANINAFGDLAMAGCGSYFKLEGFAFLPITSFTMAITTFVGQNLGAGDVERTKKGARFGVICTVICAEIIGILMVIFIPFMMRWFTDNPDVMAYGIEQARTEAGFYFLLAFAHAAASVMTGAGKSVVPMVIMLSFWCVVRVSYISIIVRFIEDIKMVFLAYPITWGLSCVVYVWYLASGRWLKCKNTALEK